MSRLRAACLALAALWAGPAVAQNTEPALLAIDSLVSAGDVETARMQLDAWLAANPPGAAGSAPGSLAHALFLKGRLARDWAGAEDALLSVVLGYPTSPRAPDALLLLGKGLVAVASTGKPATAAIRAASYLERLINDYPGNPLRDDAQLWLARAWAAAGRSGDACGLLRRIATTTQDPDTGDQIRTEIRTTCNPAPNAATTDSAAPPIPQAPPPTATRLPDDTTRQPADDVRGPFTIQVAALRSRENAIQLADQLARSGFNARVVQVEGSQLVRVRVDTFASSADAQPVLIRIRELGHDAVIVDDVKRESPGREPDSLCADCTPHTLSHP